MSEKNEKSTGERRRLRAFGACVWLALLWCPVILWAADFSDGTAGESARVSTEVSVDDFTEKPFEFTDN